MPIRKNQLGGSYRKGIAHPAREAIAALYLSLEAELKATNPDKHVTCRALAEKANTSISNAANVIRALKRGQIDRSNLPTTEEEIQRQLEREPPPPLSKAEANRKYREKKRKERDLAIQGTGTDLIAQELIPTETELGDVHGRLPPGEFTTTLPIDGNESQHAMTAATNINMLNGTGTPNGWPLEVLADAAQAIGQERAEQANNPLPHQRQCQTGAQQRAQFMSNGKRFRWSHEQANETEAIYQRTQQQRQGTTEAQREVRFESDKERYTRSREQVTVDELAVQADAHCQRIRQQGTSEAQWEVELECKGERFRWRQEQATEDEEAKQAAAIYQRTQQETTKALRQVRFESDRERFYRSREQVTDDKRAEQPEARYRGTQHQRQGMSEVQREAQLDSEGERFRRRREQMTEDENEKQPAVLYQRMHQQQQETTETQQEDQRERDRERLHRSQKEITEERRATQSELLYPRMQWQRPGADAAQTGQRNNTAARIINLGEDCRSYVIHVSASEAPLLMASIGSCNARTIVIQAYTSSTTLNL
jgi:hypothetical protein